MIKIGYGIADFETMVQDDLYYVDRTQYITKLENASSRYIAFLRPRRFGKSMWISVLECYYGLEFKDKFDALFGNYHVGTHPTILANSYLILRFNFSAISTDTDEKMEKSFLLALDEGISRFIKNYPHTITKKGTHHFLWTCFCQNQ